MTSLSGFARRALVAIVAAAITPLPALATWSVVAVDLKTGRLVLATATCVSQTLFSGTRFGGLMDIQGVVVPGYGVAAAQSASDPTRRNQALIEQELRKGTHPSVILQMLMADSSIQRRQFGIIDIKGRFAGFTGAGNTPAALYVQGQVPGTDIHYSVQGNTLRGTSVIQNAVRALEAARGTITDRVMAAMEAAEAAGGDSRCSCTSNPLPKGPCVSRNSMVAYIVAADTSDAPVMVHTDGASYICRQYPLFLYVTDVNTTAGESVNPIVTLRRRYDAWKRAR
jgi:uncharacterized Ntn-hydrolase superfamily protein